jgi:hypothetical protein
MHCVIKNHHGAAPAPTTRDAGAAPRPTQKGDESMSADFDPIDIVARYDWSKLLGPVDLVADAFPGARQTLAVEVRAIALGLPQSNTGRPLLLHKAELLSAGAELPTRDLTEAAAA